jgi:hypothetical protein
MGRLGLRQSLRRKSHGDAVDVGGDQRSGASVGLVAECGDEAGALWAMGSAAVWFHLYEHQISIDEIASVGDDQTGLAFAIDRLDADFAPRPANHAQDPVSALSEPLKQASLALAAL